MKIKELRKAVNMTQRQFSDYLNIPIRTIQDWEQSKRTPPIYIVDLIEFKLKNEKLL